MTGTDMANKAERVARIHEIRQWGTTEDAENVTLSILAALPEDTPMLGIFPTGFNEDDETGDGGISLQRVTTTSCIIVQVNSTGDIVECHRVDDDSYSEADIQTPADAAAYLS